MDTSKIHICFWVSLGTILGILTTILILLFSYGEDIVNALTYQSQYLLDRPSSSLTKIDEIRVSRLLEKNIIFSADDLLGQIGTFYTAIISILISLIATMSLFTFFFIKSSAEEKASSQAKTTAKEAIKDKIEPKIDQINIALKNFNENSLKEKFEDIIKSKIFDSVIFWNKIQESIYKNSDEALQDYGIDKINEELNNLKINIESISSTIQEINSKIDEFENSEETGDNRIVNLDNQ